MALLSIKPVWLKFKKLSISRKLTILFGAVALIEIIVVAAILITSVKPTDQPLSNPTAEAYRQKLPSLKENAENKPKDVNAQREYAVALYATNHLEEARAQYEKAIALSPNDSTLRNNLGNTCRDLRDYEKASAYYRKAFELNPQLVSAYVNLANMLIYTQHDVEGGIAIYQQALRNMPDNAEVKILLGLTYEQKGDKDRALAVYQEVLAAHPNNAAAKSNSERLEKQSQ